tara:strand:- start:687 stop:1211 length:525 start_codon:yes stop_codon:yes gene_type:complete
MKYSSLLFLCFFLFGCGNSQKFMLEYLNEDIPIVYEVTLKFKFIPPYCGGAAPNEEMEAERLKGLPWSSQVLYMNKNNTDSYESFVTDQYGYLRLALLKGKYCIKKPYKIVKSKVEEFKKEGWEFDEECLLQEMEKCDFSFEVTKDTTIMYEVRGRCHYNGPIPCVLNPGPPPP